MSVDYQKICIELFGTDDVNELRKIANKKSGRKRRVTKEDMKTMLDMQKGGMSVQEIADKFGLSRQTVSRYLNEFPSVNYTMRLDYMHRQKVCTQIYVDFLNKNISVVNRTNDILYRAFGVNEKPTWDDFEYFLRDRCIPESRGDKDDFLKRIGVDSFDPLQIVEKTSGRMAEDNQYIKFVYKERGV